VPRRGNGENGIRNGVRYRRKVISGGRGIDMQNGWMLWVFRGWDGFVSDYFIIFLVDLFFFGFFLLVFIIFCGFMMFSDFLATCRSPRLADPWLYFYQHDPSFGRICRTFLFCRARNLAGVCPLNPRGRVSFASETSFWCLAEPL
jgi:hypothetical protein